MNGVKLAVVLNGMPQVFTFNTKKAAQMMDRLLTEEFGEVASKIIYDEETIYTGTKYDIEDV